MSCLGVRGITGKLVVLEDFTAGNGTITGANRMTNAEANTKTHTTFYVDSNTSAYVDYATFDAEL